MRSILLAVLFTGCFSGFAAAQGARAEEDASPLREQSIYIPYDKLQETFEKEGRGVFVPYERFQELWQAARRSQVKPRPATVPVKAMITEVRSLATVEEAVVRVEATLKIDLLAAGWLTVPLRLADAAVLSATLNGAPARLVPHTDGQALLLKKENRDPEQIELQLVYARAFAKAPGRNSVSFQAPQAPVNRWEVRVPDTGVKVNVHPMLATTEMPSERSDAEAETVVLAFVGAAPQVRIDWTPKAEGATGLDALVGVQTNQRLVVEEGITRTFTSLTYDISRAELSQLRLEVPADQKVVNVLDANVRSWNVEPQGDRQLVNVELFQPAQKTQRLSLELERFREQQQGEVVAPVVQALGVGRQRGVIQLQVQSGLRAEVVRREGVSQLSAGELTSGGKDQKVDASYRYAALPFDLAFRVEKVQPRIVVDQLVEAVLTPRRMEYWLTLKYDIQKAGVFELGCRLPEGFEVREVRGLACAGAKAAVVESFATDAEDAQYLRVNLGSKAEGNVGLAVRLLRELEAPNLLTPTGESEAMEFEPPRATGPLIVRATGRFVLYAPESLRLISPELTGLRSIAVSEALAPIPSQAQANGQASGVRPALAYAFAGETALAQVQVQRRQPQVTVRQLLVARIDPGKVKYEAEFRFQVRYSGVNAFRIDLPDAVASKFRNETRALRDEVLSPAPDDVASGYTAIELTRDTELLGAQTCRLTWEEPIDDLAVGKSVDLNVPSLIPRNVARADGQIVLVKAETIDVRPQSVPAGLEPIDPQMDLIQGANVPDAAAALEFRQSDWALTLTATRYQLENLKHTSIERSVLRMVVTRSERVAVQALYRIRSNMQRLEIELPYDASSGQLEFDTEPLRINGRAVTLERGDGPRTFFVPLVGHATNEPLLMELRYTMPGDGTQLRYPHFPHDPATQRVHLVAYLPDERELIGRSGPWAADMDWRVGDFAQRSYVPRHDVRHLVGQLQQGIEVMGNPSSDFPVQGTPLLFTTLRPQHPDDGALKLRTVDKKVLDAIVLVSCLTVGVLLLSQTYLIRFVVTCLSLGGGLVLGLFAPTLAGQVLDQTLLVALVLVALLWLCVSLLQGVRRWKWRSTPALVATGAGAAVATDMPAAGETKAESTSPSKPADAAPPPEEAREGTEVGNPEITEPRAEQDAGTGDV